MVTSAFPTTKETSNKVVEHFFRHEKARVISQLASRFSTTDIGLIEDVVQEALIKAMKVWPFKGIPENPSAWIFLVSKNHLVDQLKKKNTQRRGKERIKQSYYADTLSQDELLETGENDMQDSLLIMMFTCCHSALTLESQVILTLKIMCGLGNEEVAQALLKTEDAVAKSFTRAKAKLKQLKIKPCYPNDTEIKARTHTVLNILYLLFNEGYVTTKGDALIKKDLCEEAIYLTQLLLENKLTAQSEIHALLALMYFQASRFDSRIDAQGKLLTLAEQDRNLWNTTYISSGLYHLTQSTESYGYSEFHIQAAIASYHCVAPDYEATNWRQILFFYDILIKLYPSMVRHIHRIVPYSKVYGPAKALDELSANVEEAQVKKYHLYYAVKGDLLLENGSIQTGLEALRKAVRLTKNEVEKNHLLLKIREAPPA